MTLASPSTSGAPRCTAELPCLPESVGRARALVASVLAAWGMEGDSAGCGEIIVSELMTNVVDHTETPLAQVTIERCVEGSVRIGVSDGSHTAPHVKIADDDVESGRGLRLVATLSLRWGYDTHPWGKVTWAILKAPAGSAQ